MNTTVFQHQRRQRAHGFALFTSMMFLIILTTLAVVVLKTSTNNERIAGSDLDRALAYQLAEATIRDAQQDIVGLLSNGTRCVAAPPACRPQSDQPNKDVGATEVSYKGTCVLGRCYLGRDSEDPPFLGATDSLYDNPGFVPPWNMPRLTPADPARPYAVFGQFTGADWAAVSLSTGVTARPLYWIEVFSYGPTGADKFRYRITVEAVGRNPLSVVRLQEIYEPGMEN
jgi:type IV pilus assembly protein PilX